MKKFFSIISFLIIAVVMLQFTSCSKESDTIDIGCLAPLSGDGANYGRSTKEGIDLAVEEINNAKLLSKSLKIIYEDDKMDPATGVNAIKKLIDINKVPLIIGPFGSSIVMSTAPIANSNKTIIISASATADAIADAGDYVFRITPPNSKQGSDDAIFSINKLSAKTASIIYQINDYGETLKDAFEKKFKELGGKILGSEGVQLNTSDLRSVLYKIKSQNPDVIFFPLHYKESGIMLKQAKEIGIKAFFISADGAMTDDLLKIAGNAAEGSFYSTLALGYGVADEQIKKFDDNFKKKYGQEPDIYAAYYYEVTRLVAKAIKAVDTDTEKIKEYLYSINGNNSFFGITGNTSFDKKGEVDKNFYIYQVNQGKYILYTK